MRKHSKTLPSLQPSSTDQARPAQPYDDKEMLRNLIGLGAFSSRKSYYPELLTKIEELEAEKERYKWLFEHALHGIFQARDQGRISVANPAIARICGYPSVTELLQIDPWEKLFHRTEDYRQLLKLLYRDGQRAGFETELLTRDGNRVAVSMNVLLKDPKNGLVEAFVQDITERKKAQQALMELNQSLERRVHERTLALTELNRQQHQEIKERKIVEQALSVAKQEAEQANRSKDKYLAAASHDLLQPLNAARLLVSTLQERQMEGRNLQLVDRIHTALQGAEELLTDLLDISKLDANAINADFSEFPVSLLFSMLNNEYQPLAQKNGLLFRSVASSRIVRSDIRLLMRVLRNFISNAIRYTAGGSVLLGCRPKGSMLQIMVCDTGNGIPPQQLKQVFQEFKQLDNAQPGRDKGVGLGLAIVERLARIMEHPIDAQSRLGHGCCFSIAVPLSEKQQNTAEPLPTLPPQSRELDGTHLLVIENDAAVLDSMEALLNEWRCQVSSAADGVEALAQCRQQLPQLIVADYHLDNDVTGLDVIISIRRLFGEQIPAIVISADRSDEVRQLLRSHGILRLNKPVKPGKLRALISHCLSQGLT